MFLAATSAPGLLSAASKQEFQPRLRGSACISPPLFPAICAGPILASVVGIPGSRHLSRHTRLAAQLALFAHARPNLLSFLDCRFLLLTRVPVLRPIPAHPSPLLQKDLASLSLLPLRPASLPCLLSACGKGPALAVRLWLALPPPFLVV